MERIGVLGVHTPFCVCLPAPPPPAAGFCVRFVALTLRSVYLDFLSSFRVEINALLLDLLPLYTISIFSIIFSLLGFWFPQPRQKKSLFLGNLILFFFFSVL
jgi:hypothetical protein